MAWAKADTIQALFELANQTPVVDAHTHVQDDLLDFDEDLAARNLAGTQAPINRFPDYLVAKGVEQRRLVRRTMMDVAHGCFYSWFAEVVEGRRGRLDAIIHELGDNEESNRRRVGKLLVDELQDARFSEYAEWLRFMFRLYDGARDLDPLDPGNYEAVYEAVQAQRNDPQFADAILRDNRVVHYVTSIENRDKIPLDPTEASADTVDLSYATHPEAYCMFDANYLVWPSGATDFGLFFGGHKYEGERFLLNLEQALGVVIDSPKKLRSAVREFFLRTLHSPETNPSSRVLYTDMFHPMDYRLGGPYDEAAVATAIRFRKGSLGEDGQRQLAAFVTHAMLEALDEIGAEFRRNGHEYGSCLQIAIGVTYFMDQSREIQSFPLYAPGIPQDEYPVWQHFPNVHFEYIVAHEQLYKDFSNAAKQVGNVSVGPWWHFFRKHNIARMLYDQLTMGPVSAIASGFTDARFVEMLAAKYQSVRWAVAAALAELVDDPASSLCRDFDTAGKIIREVLLENPAKLHHLPVETT